MKALWHWLFGKPCEHDWKDLDQAELSVRGADGTQRVIARVYVKECQKCHRIWSQRVP